jgi:hypothetical protein
MLLVDQDEPGPAPLGIWKYDTAVDARSSSQGEFLPVQLSHFQLGLLLLKLSGGTVDGRM